MNQVLSLSLRPQRLSDLVGQKQLVAAIRSQIQSGRLPHAWLFSGLSGGGKTTIARIIAVALQCTHTEVWGDSCDACLQQRNKYQIFEINASEVNGVEEIGKIASSSVFSPIAPSRYRVFILDEAQMLTSNAQNLLLKHFEDAPETTVWIICTTAPNKILMTLRRRCMSYAVSSLSIKGRELFLQKAAATLPVKVNLDPLIEQVHYAQLGSPGMLLMALEKYAAGLSPQAAVSGGSDATTENAYRICLAVSNGKWNDLRALLAKTIPEESRWIRASVSGWFRGMLLKEGSPERRAKLSKTLLQLSSSDAPLDDAALMNWLIAVLSQVCDRK